MPTLEVITGPRSGARWPILENRFTLGRVAGCDLEINESVTGPASQSATLKGEVVSRRHAVISLVDGEWGIEDGDGRGKPSKHGTTVNGQRLVPSVRRPLRNGDRIRIWRTDFEFHLDPPSTFSVEDALSIEESRPILDGQPAEQLRLLLDVSTALRGTLDADELLRRALDHLFRLFPRTRRGLVLFRDTPTDSLTVRAFRTTDDGPPDPRFSTTVVQKCLEGMEAIRGNDLPAQFPASRSVSEMPPHSLMCTPLWTTDGSALGAIQIDRRVDGTKYSPDDLGLLLGVASQVSVALSNARLYQESLATLTLTRDLQIGSHVQQALLPAEMPAVPGYEFAAYYQAARVVGGDYYDFVTLADGRLAVLLGDVEGKGVPAGLVMAKFGVEARGCLELEPDPAAAVARLNARLCRGGPRKFVTLAVAVLDPTSHTVTVVTAGHPSPLLIRAGGEVEEVVPHDGSGFMIGIPEGTDYRSHAVTLGPGDHLLIYSDGVSDAMDANDHTFGEGGIRSVVGGGGTPGAVLDRLVAALTRHSADCPQTDDITMVCFTRTGD